MMMESPAQAPGPTFRRPGVFSAWFGELEERHAFRCSLGQLTERELRDRGIQVAGARIEAGRAWWQPIDWEALADRAGAS